MIFGLCGRCMVFNRSIQSMATNCATVETRKRKIGVTVEPSSSRTTLDSVRTGVVSKKIRLGNNPMDSAKPEYIIENGLRKVRPYYYTFCCYVKRRWLGRSLFDVFTNEFRMMSNQEKLEKSTKLGRLTINDKKVDVNNYKLKDNDYLKHTVHRHEVAVFDVPIEIIADTDDFFAINKPASIPVHPTGRYNFNTITNILRIIYGYDKDKLRISYRLDRTTSGVLLFAKHVGSDRRIKDLISQRKVDKEYVCRVEGEFPSEAICDSPIDTLSHQVGIHFVSENGKHAKTSFKLDWTDGKTSVVRCFPETGRTHQIRVHLQYLGYPIINDYIYNSETFGAQKGKNGEFGKTKEELVSELLDKFSSSKWICYDTKDDDNLILDDNEEIDVEKEEDNISQYYDKHCYWCRVKTLDPTEEYMRIDLHCLKYKFEDISFESPLPAWAIKEQTT